MGDAVEAHIRPRQDRVILDRPTLFRWVDGRIPLAFAALCLTGCQGFLSSSEYTWMWAASPLAVVLFLGGAWVLTSRRRQLRDWDLATSPSEPSVIPILIRLVIFALVLLVAFGVYNWMLKDVLASKQIALNIGAWLIGSILGGALAFLLGLRLAEPRKL